MQREEHMIGDTFAYRFTDPSADHVLLVQHGTGGHGGIYDKFGAHYAGLGAEVWCMDAPAMAGPASTVAPGGSPCRNGSTRQWPSPTTSSPTPGCRCSSRFLAGYGGRLLRLRRVR